MGKCALITGITGQDGSYLAELLLDKGYRVVGAMRRASTDTTAERLSGIRDDIEFVEFDLTDGESITRMVRKVNPDEVYNLAAQSHVGLSFEQPHATMDMTGYGADRIFRSVRELCPEARVYQASTSELFGNASSDPIVEETPFAPRSPYARAKLMAHTMVREMRSQGMFICAGILFNHESPRRGIGFVTRKISTGVAKIKLGLSDHLELGNLDAVRDWGYAPDYVEVMWRMLQQERPRDYVVGTGVGHTVYDFVDAAFRAGEIPDWEARKLVRQNQELMRPAEVNHLVANPARARAELGWTPSVDFDGLVRIMVEFDIQRLGGGVK